METQIYNGIRGVQFEEFIRRLLKRGNLKQKYIDYLIDPDSMKLYSQAFTSPTADEKCNYEIMEQLGDLTANKAIVWYFFRRYPGLNNPEALPILALLKIKYGSKKVFFDIANNLGFWDYITASVESRTHIRKSLLEDTLEAFLGATELIIDTRIRQGVGYSICYDIVKSFFDEKPISLKYENLMDAKTRLKEVFDLYKDQGQPKYEIIETVKTDEGFALQTVGVYIVPRGAKSVDISRLTPIAVGKASIRIDAEQKAADYALRVLAGRGMRRDPPAIYKEAEKW